MVDQLLTSFLDPQERAASSSNITRTGGMMAGIKIFFDHPLLGTGFGTQSLYQAEYYPIWAKDSEEVVSGLSVVEPTTHRYREMPSVLLTRVLAEGGIIGFFIWLLMFAYIVYDCVYMWKHTPYHNDILFFKSIAWMVCISQLLSFNINYILKLRTPETLMRQGFIRFSDIRQHHIMHTVSGTFPIDPAVLP